MYEYSYIYITDNQQVTVHHCDQKGQALTEMGKHLIPEKHYAWDLTSTNLLGNTHVYEFMLHKITYPWKKRGKNQQYCKTFF